MHHLISVLKIRQWITIHSYQDFLISIIQQTKRRYFPLFYCFILYGVRNLYVVSLSAKILCNKINFFFPVLPNVNNISPPKQLQIYQIFNNVRDLDLSVMNIRITKSHVSLIILILRL